MKLSEDKFKSLIWSKINDLLMNLNEPREYYFNVVKVGVNDNKTEWCVLVDNKDYTMAHPLYADEGSDEDIIDISCLHGAMFVKDVYAMLNQGGKNSDILFELAARLHLGSIICKVNGKGIAYVLSDSFDYIKIISYNGFDEIKVKLKCAPYSCKDTIKIDKYTSAGRIADEIRETIYKLSMLESL